VRHVPATGPGGRSSRPYSPKLLECVFFEVTAVWIRYHKLSALLWIEHYPTETTDGASETFEMVVFSSYEVTEREHPTWERQD
jgi:hypothetical protein